MPTAVTRLALKVAVLGLIAACSPSVDAPSDAGGSSPAPTQTESGTTVPTQPTTGLPVTPQEVVTALAVQAGDLAEATTVTELPPADDLLGEPTFALCNWDFQSERRRIAVAQFAAQDESGALVVGNQNVVYDEFDAAELALTELRAAADNCPIEQYDFQEVAESEVAGLAEDRVVLRNVAPGRDPDGPVVTVVQRREAVLVILYGEALDPVLAAARAAADRLHALP